MTSLEIVPISTSDEVRRLGEILCQCFNSPPADWSMHCERLGLQNFRLIYQNREMLGGLGYYPMGQWFGGRCVPLAGVAAIGVAPEYRGRGVALHLMRHMLQEFAIQGIPLSTLYPSTQSLYRKVGYEQGGTYCHWELPLYNTSDFSNKSEALENWLPMHRIISQPELTLAPIYRCQAQQTNGFLERNAGIWQSIFQHDTEVYVYVIGDLLQPQGYIVYGQKGEGEESYLEVWDWVALSVAAMRRLWFFLSSHSTQMQTVRWRAGASDPRLLLLPEQIAKMRQLSFWLLRVVNVVQALESRGYPTELEAELHLEVSDSLFANNHRRFMLTVAAGVGKVSLGGKGELQLDIRALAPLYTGLLTALQLQNLGQLAGSERSIATATLVFSGEPPAMTDFF
jgi:predicted acetyltransferase